MVEERPLLADENHPIETGKYLLATAEINRMCEEVNTWIENRSPGGIIYGNPRIGKSNAIRYLTIELAESRWGKLPIVSLDARKYTKPSEARFFEDLLRGANHGLVQSGGTSLKRDRLNVHLLEKTRTAGSDRIIIIIDEAQRFEQLQYHWLMDVYNELNTQGVYMTVLLVGQRELLNCRSSLLTSNDRQIVGRFMVDDFHFRGIRNVNDMAICLERYDEYTEYPLGSGWSFTRYYFPDEYAEGFRLKEYAEMIFEDFGDLRQEKGVTGSFEIPMQYFTLMVEYVLKHFGSTSDDYIQRLGKKQWRNAIESSGYIKAEIYQNII